MARLYLVGLGLSPSFLTEEARRALRDADCVFADVYTSYFGWASRRGPSAARTSRTGEAPP